MWYSVDMYCVNADFLPLSLMSIHIVLYSIHQIPSVPIVDCYQKIRQQVKCYLQMAGVVGKNELQEVSHVHLLTVVLLAQSVIHDINFSLQTKKLAAKDVSEMTYFVLCGTLNLISVNQSMSTT